MGKTTDIEKVSQEKLTKVERQKKYGDLKYRMKNVWTTEMESSTDETGKEGKPMIEAPSHYCKYTIKDRTLVIQKPMREPKPNVTDQKTQKRLTWLRARRTS